VKTIHLFTRKLGFQTIKPGYDILYHTIKARLITGIKIMLLKSFHWTFFDDFIKEIQRLKRMEVVLVYFCKFLQWKLLGSIRNKGASISFCELWCLLFYDLTPLQSKKYLNLKSISFLNPKYTFKYKTYK